MDALIDRAFSDEGVYPGGCGIPRRQQAEITIDGTAGRIAECPNRIEATVAAGGMLYVFILSHEGRDARALFDAFVTSIDLTPETAVHFPNMETTFVSPTYGYSFGYLDRGGLEPTTEIWDPVNQQHHRPERFDYVDTGLGAGFQGRSVDTDPGGGLDR